MRKAKTIFAVGVLTVQLLLGLFASAPGKAQAALASIVVSPGSATIGVGSTQQFNAIGIDQNGMPGGPAGPVTWASSDTNVGTIDANGLFTAVAAGSTTITAANGVVSGTATMAVVDGIPPIPGLVSVKVNPDPAAVAAGSVLQFYAFGIDAGNMPLGGRPTDFSWTSSDSAVGTIDANGLFTAVAAGTATITAQNGAITGTATVKVTKGTPPVAGLASIRVSPNSVFLGANATQQFTAMLSDGNGMPIPGTVDWASSDTNVGTIDANGSFTAVAAGSTTITAANGAVSGTANVTVTQSNPVLTTINITPTTVTLSAGQTRQFSAETLDQNGNPIVAMPIWNSSDTAVGTIDAMTGIFTAISAGTTTITATGGAKTASVQVKVAALAIPQASQAQSVAAAAAKNNPQVAGPDDGADLTIQKLDIVSITKNSMELFVKTSTNSNVEVVISTNRKNVQKDKKNILHVSDGQTDNEHSVVLSGLKKNKNHFWKLTVQKNDGSQRMETAIFRVKTLKR